MNREIKFRAWHKENREMREVTNLDLPNTTENEWLVAMQYTGLVDKNGKEIYEGDVIEYQESKHIKVRCQIEWEIGGWTATNTMQGLANLRLSEMWEVIGNIYENPELLEEDAK